MKAVVAVLKCLTLGSDDVDPITDQNKISDEEAIILLSIITTKLPIDIFW